MKTGLRVLALLNGQIQSGAYASVSEMVRAGVRMLMERDGVRQFYAPRVSLEQAVHDAKAGEFEQFNL